MIRAVVHGSGRLQHPATRRVGNLGEHVRVLLDLTGLDPGCGEHTRGFGEDVRRKPERKLQTVVGHADAIGCRILGRGRPGRPGGERAVPAQDGLHEHVHIEDEGDITHAA